MEFRYVGKPNLSPHIYILLIDDLLIEICYMLISDIIEKHLPIQKQISLLRDLCTISFGKICTVPIPLEFDCVPSKWVKLSFMI